MSGWSRLEANADQSHIEPLEEIMRGQSRMRKPHEYGPISPQTDYSSSHDRDRVGGGGGERGREKQNEGGPHQRG